MTDKVLILDLDGPVLDCKERHFECYKDILERNSFKPLGIEEYWELKRNKVDRFEQLKKSGAEDFYDSFLKEWLSNIEDKKYLRFDKLHVRAAETLNKWKCDGVDIILLTMRHNRENLIWELEEKNILNFFKEVVPVNSLDKGKNKASAVAEYIDGKNFSTYWVGDTEMDIEAAKKHNIEIFAVKNGIRTGEILETYKPDYLVDSIEKINFNWR